MSNYRLISTPRWIWLATLVLCVISGLLYGIFGDVTRTVSAVGVTRHGEQLLMVTAGHEGTVAEILVARGALIQVGDPVVRFVTDEIDADLARIRDRISLLTTESASLEGVENSTRQAAVDSRDATLREVDQLVTAAKELLSRRQKFLSDQESLLKDGLIAGESVLRSRAELAELQNSIDEAESDAAAARLSVVRLDAELAVARAARREALASANAELRLLEISRQNDFTVRSDLAGLVEEIGVAPGSFVQQGDQIARLLPETATSNDLQIVAFVPQATGKIVAAGDVVQIIPTFVDVSRYGYMLGRVTWISEEAAIPEELSLLLADPVLITGLLERDHSILVARITLDRDPASPSGFKWSSMQGWPGTIAEGIVVDMNIVYEVDRPIELFLPWIRSLIGE